MHWKALLTGFRMHIFSPRNSTGLKSYSRLNFFERAKCANVYTIRAHTFVLQLTLKNKNVYPAPKLYVLKYMLYP